MCFTPFFTVTRMCFTLSFSCFSCQIPMLECSRKDLRDTIGWKCSSCKTHRSVRDGSFFAKYHLTLQQWVMLLHFWTRQNPVLDTAECVKVAENTAIDAYQWLREVCSTRLINDGPVVLGGPGIVVQIDESLFKHKPKVHTTQTHTGTNTHTGLTLL